MGKTRAKRMTPTRKAVKPCAYNLVYDTGPDGVALYVDGVPISGVVNASVRQTDGGQALLELLVRAKRAD